MKRLSNFTKGLPEADTSQLASARHQDPMSVENRAHARWVEIYIVLREPRDLSDVHRGMDDLRRRVEVHIGRQPTSNAPSDCQLCLGSKREVQVATITLFDELCTLINVTLSLFLNASFGNRSGRQVIIRTVGHVSFLVPARSFERFRRCCWLSSTTAILNIRARHKKPILESSMTKLRSST